MIDIQKMLIKAMKNEFFSNPDEELNKALNLATRQILGEMKTKFKDIQEEITIDIQYKMLQKMKKDRENSVKIYTEAFAKTNSSIAKENLNKSKLELAPIDIFLSELEDKMPKKMSEEDTKKFILDTWKNIQFTEKNPNKGILMKAIKTSGKNVDMSLVAKLVKECLNI